MDNPEVNKLQRKKEADRISNSRSKRDSETKEKGNLQKKGKMNILRDRIKNNKDGLAVDLKDLKDAHTLNHTWKEFEKLNRDLNSLTIYICTLCHEV